MILTLNQKRGVITVLLILLLAISVYAPNCDEVFVEDGNNAEIQECAKDPAWRQQNMKSLDDTTIKENLGSFTASDYRAMSDDQIHSLSKLSKEELSQVKFDEATWQRFHSTLSKSEKKEMWSFRVSL